MSTRSNLAQIAASMGVPFGEGDAEYWTRQVDTVGWTLAAVADFWRKSGYGSSSTRMGMTPGGGSAHFLGALPGIVTGIGGAIGVIGGAIGGIKDAFGGNKRLPSPPSYGAPPAPPALPGGRQPEPGIGGVIRRWGERIIPGGRTGRELTPYEGTERDKMGRPIAVHPDTTTRLYAPPGYVIVNMGTAEKPQPLAVLRGVARSMGLWKPRPKPPISGYDARAIKRAARAQARVKRLAGDVGLRYSLPAAGKGRFKKKKAR